MAGRDGIGLLIYSTLLILSMPAYCTVRTSNQITTPNTSRPLIPEPRLTTNVCSDDNTDSSDSASRIVDSLQRMTGARFYLQPADIPPDQQAVLFLGHIGYALQLSPFIGLHSLVVHTNSLSVSQLEEVLTYAWTPSIEAYTRSPSAAAEDAPHVRFLSFRNSSETLTITGSPVTRIIYTIFRSKENRLLRGPQPRPTLEDKRYVKRPQQRIAPPHLESFIGRLEEKGVRVHDQLPIPAQMAAIAGSPHSDHPSLAAARKSCRQLSRNQSEACAQKRNVDVRVGGLTNYTWTSKLNGNFTQLQMTYASCLTVVDDKVWIGWLLDPNPSAAGADRPTFADVDPIDPRRSFRVYTSQPVHLQLLPLIQQKFTEKLNYYLVDGQSVEVILWNPDLDTGTTISFLVRLLINGTVVADLDARMPYADNIYTRLENEFGRSAMPGHPFSRELYISRQPVVENPSLQRDCQGPKNDEKACRLQEAFNLTIISSSNDTLPSSENVHQAVLTAFSQANPVLVSPAFYEITLISRREEKPALPGLNIVHFLFSISYHNLTRGTYWHLWKYPTNEIMQIIPQVLPGVWSFHPWMTFTVYSSEPINFQLLPRLEARIQEMVRGFSGYEKAEVVIWNRDRDGIVIQFVVVNSGGIVDPRRAAVDDGGDWIYPEVANMKLTWDTMEIAQGPDSWYSDGAVSRIITLNRHPPTTMDHQQKILARCSQVGVYESGCPLPSVFSLTLMRIPGSKTTIYSVILNSEDVLRGVGDAFAEANPVLADGMDLNITLTRRTDGFLTSQGEPIVKFDFTVTYAEMETGQYWNFWRYPDDALMNKHLRSSVFGKIVEEPFY
ncbi:uncharacterized protein LOC129581806 isoform X2 [Paramacrobiotus metropolitanus]|uniref:uncharacterized protein LOC129581806 isoform X2 n=1 Tax=Paramacrobiotus metropolitanus TaxID=2943436 RepID=UPI002445BDAD|nr:uncharacterized protein LOC129581806 isoform X2 [Paramacrobiotus metropolitanus]